MEHETLAQQYLPLLDVCTIARDGDLPQQPMNAFDAAANHKKECLASVRHDLYQTIFENAPPEYRY
jgi:hypothetical protein